MSDRLLLTAAERERFAAWLEHEARTSDGLAVQAQQLPSGAAIVGRLRTEAAAMAIVARVLRSIEGQTITSKPEGNEEPRTNSLDVVSSLMLYRRDGGVVVVIEKRGGKRTEHWLDTDGAITIGLALNNQNRLPEYPAPTRPEGTE